MKSLCIVIVGVLFARSVASDPVILVINDSNKGISSVIFMNDEHKGKTDDQGKLTLVGECPTDAKVVAKPASPYYEPGANKCNPQDKSVRIKVTWKPVYLGLLRKQQLFIAQDDYAAVAFASTEIAARTADPAKAAEAEATAIRAMGKYLRLPSDTRAVVYDPEQSKFVASPELLKALVIYQTNAGIKPTGMMDYKTLSKASKLEAANLLFSK